MWLAEKAIATEMEMERAVNNAMMLSSLVSLLCCCVALPVAL